MFWDLRVVRFWLGWLLDRYMWVRQSAFSVCWLQRSRGQWNWSGLQIKVGLGLYGDLRYQLDDSQCGLEGRFDSSRQIFDKFSVERDGRNGFKWWLLDDPCRWSAQWFCDTIEREVWALRLESRFSKMSFLWVCRSGKGSEVSQVFGKIIVLGHQWLVSVSKGLLVDSGE